MRLKTWVLLCLPSFTACNEQRPASKASAPQPADASWTAETAWRLSDEPIVRIEGGEDDIERAPLDPVNALVLPDGRYVIGDGNQAGHHALMVYDQRGRYHAKWGRDGRGPGEFGQTFSVFHYRGDSVAALDFVDHALEIFATNGKFGRQLKYGSATSTLALRQQNIGRRMSYFSDHLVGTLSDGSAVAQSSGAVDVSGPPRLQWGHADVVVLSPTGPARTIIPQLKLSRWYTYTTDGGPYAGAGWPVLKVAHDRLYYTTGEDFTIDIFDRNGSRVQTIRRDLARDPYPASEWTAFIEHRANAGRSGREGSPAMAQRIRELMGREPVPTTKPAFSAISVDADQNVWARHFDWPLASEASPIPRPGRWSVFAQSGEFLGEVQTPPRFTPTDITRHQVVGIYNDEFDVKHIHAYRLVRPGVRNPAR